MSLRMPAKMPVTLQCPGCKLELSVPESLQAQGAVCPQCRTRLVTPESRASLLGLPLAPLVIRSSDADNEMPNARDAADPAASGLMSRSPARFIGPAVPKQVAPKPVAPPISTPAPSAATALPNALPKLVVPKSTKLPPAKRPRFITADAAQSQIQPSADGQLPALVLGESGQVAPPVAERGGNPFLLTGILVVSLGLTVLMLLVETDAIQSDSQSKQAARRALHEYYLQPPLEQYQLVLREAQQSYGRGDLVRERKLYRRVLDMLHAESQNKFQGITGLPDADRPPNDRHLEETLSTLLTD